MIKKVTVSYFPRDLKFVTPLLFGAGIYLVVTRHPVWGLLLILLGAVILTTHYVTEINLKEKKYLDYLSLLGLSLQVESRTFNSLEKIIITKGNYAQTINTRAQSRQLDWSDYTGTLLMDNDNSLDLLTRNSKKDLIKGLKEYADFLQVGVEDQTTRDHFWIDLTRR
jgi:hypothetical protein